MTHLPGRPSPEFAHPGGVGGRRARRGRDHHVDHPVRAWRQLDTPEIRQGVTLYLPVSVPGAQLALGDGHCRQGEGEVCGTAVEAAMNTTIVVDVVKGAQLGWPRVQSDDAIMSTGSTRPLEDAFRASQHDLVTWTSQLTGLDLLDALQLVSQAGLAPAGNVVDTNYTMVAKLPTAVLNGATVYDGMHERLAEIGREHLTHR
ncbi:acetamidase/formamidase family protein [Knoellia sp. CPCC 206435]|uniref:acetamidase/formamidase family protein n=1 Tax=Knoellia terrae TaxID=3404797 RepID=UPI003B42BA60